MFLLRLLQTYSPDGSTIHASRLQKVNAVITQKKTMILVSLLLLQRKPAERENAPRFQQCDSFHTVHQDVLRFLLSRRLTGTFLALV